MRRVTGSEFSFIKLSHKGKKRQWNEGMESERKRVRERERAPRKERAPAVELRWG